MAGSLGFPVRAQGRGHGRRPQRSGLPRTMGTGRLAGKPYFCRPVCVGPRYRRGRMHSASRPSANCLNIRPVCRGRAPNRNAIVRVRNRGYEGLPVASGQNRTGCGSVRILPQDIEEVAPLFAGGFHQAPQTGEALDLQGTTKVAGKLTACPCSPFRQVCQLP